MPQVIYLALPGIRCNRCVEPIENALKQSPDLPLISCSTDIVEKKIRIVVTNALPRETVTAHILAILKQKKIHATAITPALIAAESARRRRRHLLEGLAGLVVGIGLMGLTLSGLALSLPVTAGITAVSVLLTLFLGRASYRESLTAFTRDHTLTMDTLFSISTLTVIAVSIAGLFVPWLPVMPAAGLLIFGFRHIGKAIEESITRRLTSDLSFKERAAPFVEKRIQRDEGEVWEKVRSDSLLPGDMIRMAPGQILPVDGICVSEQAHFYKTILNGSLHPETVTAGAELSAGLRAATMPSFVLPTVIQVTKRMQDSYLATIDEKLAEALSQKAPIEDTTDKILQYFVPGTLVMAAISGGMTGLFAGPAMGIQCGTTLLVSACPCTLGFITPLAMKVGLAKAAGRGVFFSNTAELQNAAGINAVIFDMNGTLTMGTPGVSQCCILPAAHTDPDVFFSIAAALEAHSTHPVGLEILRYLTEERHHRPALSAEPCESRHHAGISGTVGNTLCRLGNRDFMQAHGITVPAIPNNEQCVYLAIGGKTAGYFTLKDAPLRPDAVTVVNQLQQMGIAVYISTGSDIPTAQRVAAALHIPARNVFADCRAASSDPTQPNKIACVQSLKDKGMRVAMIGDADNDAAAMVKSDFGMAVLSVAGETAAQDFAGATCDGTKLLPVTAAFTIARQTMRGIRQNLFFSFVYNAVTATIAGGALLAVGIAISPPVGAALMVIQMLLLLANQCRILYQNPIPGQRIATAFATSYHSMHHQGLHPGTLQKEASPGQITVPSEPQPPVELSPDPPSPVFCLTQESYSAQIPVSFYPKKL